MSDDGVGSGARTGPGDGGERRAPDGGPLGSSPPTDGTTERDSLASERPDQGEQTRGTEWRIFGRDVLTSALAVVLVGTYLFAVSGVWPPLVAIESGSMVPNMEVNDLVFVVDEERFPGDGAVAGTGVVTAASGERTGYTKFGRPGDVIVFEPGGRDDATPIIHRAMFYVDAGEDWTKRADPAYLGGTTSCREIVHCPANRSGFITKGDAPQDYDQLRRSGARTGTVSADWVIGTAEARVPGLGWLRLRT